MSKYDYIMERADRELYRYGGDYSNHAYYCAMALCLLVENRDIRVAVDMLFRHLDGFSAAALFFSSALNDYAGGLENGKK